MLMMMLPLVEDFSLADFRSGLAGLLATIFGLGCVISLLFVVYNMYKGERENIRKFLNWTLVLAVGYALFKILG